MSKVKESKIHKIKTGKELGLFLFECMKFDIKNRRKLDYIPLVKDEDFSKIIHKLSTEEYVEYIKHYGLYKSFDDILNFTDFAVKQGFTAFYRLRSDLIFVNQTQKAIHLARNKFKSFGLCSNDINYHLKDMIKSLLPDNFYGEYELEWIKKNYEIIIYCVKTINIYYLVMDNIFYEYNITHDDVFKKEFDLFLLRANSIQGLVRAILNDLDEQIYGKNLCEKFNEYFIDLDITIFNTTDEHQKIVHDTLVSEERIPIQHFKEFISSFFENNLP